MEEDGLEKDEKRMILLPDADSNPMFLALRCRLGGSGANQSAVWCDPAYALLLARTCTTTPTGPPPAPQSASPCPGNQRDSLLIEPFVQRDVGYLRYANLAFH